MKGFVGDDHLKIYNQTLNTLLTSISTHFSIPTNHANEDSGSSLLHHTAPTFFTLLVGEEGWEAASEHDVYWTRHVDRNNTNHYHYSALLYLSTYNKDFGDGGTFHIFDEHNLDKEEWEVEVRRGRTLLFSSGVENPHQVTKIGWGERLVLSLWFTCDLNKIMELKLDRSPHFEFKKPDSEEILKDEL